MADIRDAIKFLPYQERRIGDILIEYYDTMKQLEKDPERGGKQATKIVMTINDVKKFIDDELVLVKTRKVYRKTGDPFYKMQDMSVNFFKGIANKAGVGGTIVRKDVMAIAYDHKAVKSLLITLNALETRKMIRINWIPTTTNSKGRTWQSVTILLNPEKEVNNE